MSNITVNYKLTLSSNEAMSGTKKVLTGKGKQLEITIPAGVKTGTLLKLSGAFQTTDGYYGDIVIQIKVKSRRRGVLAVTAIAGLLIIIICSVVIGYFVANSGGVTEPTVSPSKLTPALSPAPMTTPTLIYENGAICVGGDGEPIELVNNLDATNPTYAELVDFIKADTTDTKGYVEEGFMAYVCSDFAEAVHNYAEAAGIKAAWVSIDFYGDVEGHALNAFETTDRGVVYIDCTGGGLSSWLTGSSKPTLWDTVAYVEIGKVYGRIDIDKAKSLSYSFYQEYMRKWQEFETRLEAYNSEVERYNQEILGKVYIEGSTELARIEAWEARLEEEGQALDKLAKELGEGCYEQLGIVEDIHIHW